MKTLRDGNGAVGDGVKIMAGRASGCKWGLQELKQLRMQIA
jgi:hypothetical protein